MKDSFMTIAYKDGFIHSCYNRTTEKYEHEAQYNYTVVNCKSQLACKQWISRQMEGKA